MNIPKNKEIPIFSLPVEEKPETTKEDASSPQTKPEIIKITKRLNNLLFYFFAILISLFLLNYFFHLEAIKSIIAWLTNTSDKSLFFQFISAVLVISYLLNILNITIGTIFSLQYFTHKTKVLYEKYAGMFLTEGLIGLVFTFLTQLTLLLLPIALKNLH